MPTVNFDEVEESDFTPLPAGKYSVTIKDVTERFTAAGSDMWSLELEVNHGKYAGRKLWDNLVFMDGPAMQKVKMVRKRLGLSVDGTVECEPSELIGRSCCVEVIIKEYKGKKQNSIGFNYYDTGDNETTDNGTPDKTKDDNLPF